MKTGIIIQVKGKQQQQYSMFLSVTHEVVTDERLAFCLLAVTSSISFVTPPWGRTHKYPSSVS